MVKVKEGQFRGIIDIEEEAGNELILNATQRKFIDHFNRVGRGGNARYLLNGEPGW
jgi:hypothetical protein